MNLSGLFVGPLLKEFSYRKVAIVGSLLCALGLALTSPATSMAHILTTYSVINGEFYWKFYSDLIVYDVFWDILGINIDENYFISVTCVICTFIENICIFYFIQNFIIFH